MNIVLIIATCISCIHFLVALFTMWRLLCVLMAAGIGHKMHGVSGQSCIPSLQTSALFPASPVLCICVFFNYCASVAII